ncbi:MULTISPECIES: hypothetical protein [unclassified Streptomyces]|uniref:hypothetical protein n=1 Tax=unclassified Streptomyces TaxID=2593676 RepID=UPI000F6CEFA1|nr:MULTISPECIES: hypothetical protein [unclassified Streptomyces]AZM60416.1 hypothetical protein DLM49_13355 [Streptomyces sp. WAC 01438]RSM94364.1 hypothetical protein DMA10_18960 [Streptomyces sp. WAC 01420]
MSLVELIAQADERGLAVSGLACLDRCVPLLGGDDEVLRPLWSSLAEDAAAGDWAERLEQARGKLDAAPGDTDEPVALAHRMLATAPVERSLAGLREWADACSLDALRIHRLLDGAADDGGGPAEVCREGEADGLSPLLAAELRRQMSVLELVAAHGPAGLRGALEVSTEGRRVLRAAVSRRSRRDG